MSLRGPRCRDDLFLGRVGPPERDVLAHGRGEEERVLRDDADGAAERVEPHVAHVRAVHRHASLRHVVEPWDKGGERRLPGAGVSDQRDRATRLELEVDLVQHRPLRVVAERHALVAHEPAAGRQLHGVGRVDDVLGLVDDLEDPLARGRRPLRLADPHAEHAQRHHEHQDEHVELDERAQ